MDHRFRKDRFPGTTHTYTRAHIHTYTHTLRPNWGGKRQPHKHMDTNSGYRFGLTLMTVMGDMILNLKIKLISLQRILIT